MALVAVLLLLISINCAFGENDVQKIKVLASVMEPFVIYDGHSRRFTGLDVDILENFAKKIHFEVEFVASTKHLNEIFCKENKSIDVSQLIQDLWVYW